MTDYNRSSYLEERRSEIMAGRTAVPLDYDELQELAAEHLSNGSYDYVAGGAGTEETVLANRAAFRRYRIVPRVLRDVSERDVSTRVFGRESAAPLVLAPIGGQTKYHEDGELATARAAGKLGIPITLSTVASRSIEEVAEANGDGPRYFQLYWPNEWTIAESFVKRAEDANYDALVLTVDSKLPKWRLRNLKNAYEGSMDARKAVFETDPVVESMVEEAGRPLEQFVRSSRAVDDDPSIDWDSLDTLREWTDLPIVLKGIVAEADARRAAEWGVDGIVVSNHGGRQIDEEVTAVDQLSRIVDAVGEETTVILDSGIRTGADAFIGLALGADAVQFGRPYIFGLAIAGETGVKEVVLNLLAELDSIIGLSGHRTVEEITREAIQCEEVGYMGFRGDV